jgi:uncharacterized membrane protein
MSPEDNDNAPNNAPDENTSEFEERVKSQVQDKSTWLRLFFMLLFIVIFYFVFFIACAVGILQFFARIFSGKPLASLYDFNSTLADYSKDLVAYITFASDAKPYPFKE